MQIVDSYMIYYLDKLLDSYIDRYLDSYIDRYLDSQVDRYIILIDSTWIPSSRIVTTTPLPVYPSSQAPCVLKISFFIPQNIKDDLYFWVSSHFFMTIILIMLPIAPFYCFCHFNRNIYCNLRQNLFMLHFRSKMVDWCQIKPFITA